MLRKKNYRDPIGSLELGGAVQMTSSFRVKRFSYKKILKYVVLIILGIAIHSIYREIFQAHNVDELHQNSIPVQDSIHVQQENERAPPDRQAPQEVPIHKEPPGGRILDNDEHIKDHEKPEHEKAKQTDDMAFKEHGNNMAPPDEVVHNQVEQNQIPQETNERIVDHNENLDNFREEVNEFPVEEDLGKFEKIVDLNEDMQENQSNIKVEEEIQKEIANIMENAYEDIKLEHPPKEAAHVQEAISNDDVIDVEPPKELEKMKEAVQKVEALPLNYKEVVKPHDHGLPNLVTAALSKDVLKLEQLILSVQRFFPNEKIYVYDIDLQPRQYKLLSAMCNVRMRSLMLDVFPNFVKNITNFHWRPLVMHIAVTEFEHITWLNHNMRLKNAQKLLAQVPKAHDSSVYVIGQTAGYTSFAVTHPDMYKFIATDRKKLAAVPHIEIYALIMHNTEELRENLMKLLLSCTMNPACLAPPGAGTHCDFDFSGRLYAKCHQYDESAINILLKNWFQFDKSRFMSGNCCFSNYNPNERIRPQICHRTRGVEIEDL